MDFDEAVNQALGEPEPEQKPKRKRDEPEEPRKPKKKREKKKKEEERPPKREEEEEEENVDQQNLYAQLIRYCEAFPECADGIMVAPDAPQAEIEFQLATIQRRINAKNELGMMRAGLVTGCMLFEAGNDMMGSPVLLKGFATSVQASAQDFDDVLKQILCKYGGNFSLSCEATLGLLLCKHAANAHMANMVEKAKKEAEAKLKIEELPEAPEIKEEVTID
jgi:hypothetical protein